MVSLPSLRKAAPGKQTLFLFSDVNASPMLLSIVKNIQQSENSLKVVVIGEKELEICQSLQQLGIDPFLIRKRSKYGLVWMLASVTSQVLVTKPTTILASGQYATILGIFTTFVLRVRRRIFIRHHSNFHTKNKMRFGILADFMANYMATKIVAVSDVVKEILINSEGVNPTKVILIRNGIDTDRFLGNDFLEEKPKSFNHHKINIGVISRMTGWKGVQYTVDAFAMLHSRYPNSHLNLVGAPADSYELIKEKLASLDTSAYSLKVWHPDILGFLQKLDIFVHVPIGPEDEAFGLVYIEALTSRTPSIFTISGVLHELPSPEKYAHIVPYEDSVAIFNKMVEIIEGVVQKRELLPQEWLQQYSLKVMGKNYLSLLIGDK
jgi:glycosyltransferase involved in cell wall biosynthesis